MLTAAVLVGDAPAEPIELAAAKAFLRIDGTAQDDEVRLLITAARSQLEVMTGLRLMEQTVRLQADRLHDLDHLTVGPVSAIAAITYRDAAGEAQSIDLDGVYLTGLDLDRGIDVVPGYAWPRSARRPIVVDLVVGYGPTSDKIPGELRHAMLALIRGMFEENPADIEPLIVNRRINA